MAKLTSALLVLALLAMPFLHGMEAAGRSLPSGGKDEEHDNKLYGASEFGWGLLPFVLLHPWLFGGPFWWLKDAKPTITIPNAKASSYYHDTPKAPKVGTTQANYASTHFP